MKVEVKVLVSECRGEGKKLVPLLFKALSPDEISASPKTILAVDNDVLTYTIVEISSRRLLAVKELVNDFLRCLNGALEVLDFIDDGR